MARSFSRPAWSALPTTGKATYSKNLGDWYARLVAWCEWFDGAKLEEVGSHPPPKPPANKGPRQLAAYEEAKAHYATEHNIWSEKNTVRKRNLEFDSAQARAAARGGTSTKSARRLKPSSDPMPPPPPENAAEAAECAAAANGLSELLGVRPASEPINSGDDLIKRVVAVSRGGGDLVDITLGMVDGGALPHGMSALRHDATRCISCTRCSLKWSADYAARVVKALLNPPSARGSFDHLFAQGACGWRLQQALQAYMRGRTPTWGLCLTCSCIDLLKSCAETFQRNRERLMMERLQLLPLSEQDVLHRVGVPIETYERRLWIGGKCVVVAGGARIHVILLHGGRSAIVGKTTTTKLSGHVYGPEVSVALDRGGAFVVGPVCDVPGAITLLAVTTGTDWTSIVREEREANRPLWKTGELPACPTAPASDTTDKTRAAVAAKNTGPLARVLRNRHSLPLAALTADGNAIDTIDKNRTFLAAHILALRHTAAQKAARAKHRSARAAAGAPRPPGGVHDDSCACCLKGRRRRSATSAGRHSLSGRARMPL